MKILLIQSYLGRKEMPVFPLGLAYLAGCLKGHDVSAIDLNVIENPFDSLKDKLKSFKPDTVGISLRNIDATMYKDNFYYYKLLEPTVNRIKEAMPQCRIIIGGAGFSLFADEIMERNPKIDFGIYLDGDETLPELLNNLSTPQKVKGLYYRQNGKSFYTGHREPFGFSNVGFPRRDFFDLNKYKNPIGIGIQSKRGCCLNCAYCTYPFLTGKSIRLRPPEKVVDEIQEVCRHKEPETPFSFADPVFNVPKEHAEEICREMIKRGVNSKWAAYFSLKGMDEAFIKLAYNAGCRTFICSPDGYTEKSLRLLKKEINRKELKEVCSTVSRLRLKDANFDFSFFISAPGQSIFSFISLLWFQIKTNFIFPGKKVIHISVTWPRLEPHTELHSIAVKEGLLSESTSLLPFTEQELSCLFYHNPNIKIGEGSYLLLLKINKALKTLKSKILR